MSESTKSKLITFASFTCVIHCIIAPFLVMAAPMLGHIFENIFIEIAVLVVSIACGIAIIYNGYCTQKKALHYIIFNWGIILGTEHTSRSRYKHALALRIINHWNDSCVNRLSNQPQPKKKCCSSDHHLIKQNFKKLNGYFTSGRP